jgi:hypothetical protein
MTETLTDRIAMALMTIEFWRGKVINARRIAEQDYSQYRGESWQNLLFVTTRLLDAEDYWMDLLREAGKEAG